MISTTDVCLLWLYYDFSMRSMSIQDSPDFEDQVNDLMNSTYVSLLIPVQFLTCYISNCII